MTNNPGNAPVIVGVDGSKTAVRAALWAAEEAAGQDSTLLLIHVIDPGRDDQEMRNGRSQARGE